MFKKLILVMLCSKDCDNQHTKNGTVTSVEFCAYQWKDNHNGINFEIDIWGSQFCECTKLVFANSKTVTENVWFISSFIPA